ncbi:MAG: DUF4442 domain-containing protein [Flavobacteriales bacterium]|nr:DUF4442 domain-containing protein [Flavobacteriales bacterium]
MSIPKGFQLLDSLMASAEKDGSGLRKLNWVMARAIPFNSPHRIKVKSVSDEKVVTSLPYKKRNLNHLKSLHAAALMTVGEYCSGLWIMKRMGTKYRVIMKTISIEYHKQGRTDAMATYELPDSEFKEQIEKPLLKDGVVFHTCDVKITNADGDLLADAAVEWQIKDWAKVKTK